MAAGKRGGAKPAPAPEPAAKVKAPRTFPGKTVGGYSPAKLAERAARRGR